jgi:hypothetical protein
MDDSLGTVHAYGTQTAKRDAFCANALFVPAGWLQVDAALTNGNVTCLGYNGYVTNGTTAAFVEKDRGTSYGCGALSTYRARATGQMYIFGAGWRPSPTSEVTVLHG